MPKKKESKKEAGVCRDCWRYKQFKEDCHFFWENKSECSKFLEHQMAEEKYMRKSLI